MTCEKCSDPLFVLSVLYGEEESRSIREWLAQRLSGFTRPLPQDPEMDQRDVFLVTSGDQFTHPEGFPLQVLGTFAGRYLENIFTGLHVLPFYPASSQDGFAVTDPYQVDNRLGTWGDIERLGSHFKLLYDLVLNQVSIQSPWFRAYLEGEDRYKAYFIAVDPETDLSEVVHPPTAAGPLLTSFESSSGTKWIWTTFGADQVDLNYANPAVLQEMIEVMLQYIGHGARLFRLDSVAYLGKEAGTACIHLSQTHLVVRLLRAILDRVAPDVKLLTETNVPHEENVSYFGNGYNEAHMVYNYALPPLVLHAFVVGQTSRLNQWASTLQLPSTETLYFNFLSSQDGISLNPAEGILSPAEIDLLVARTLRQGGRVFNRTQPDGSSSPCELKINYFDALSASGGEEPLQQKVKRFLAAHAILLSMAGLPGVSVRSLLGISDGGKDLSEENRVLDHRKMDLARVEQALADRDSRTAQIYQGISQLVRARAASAAFHPYGIQLVLEVGSAVFALMRISPDGTEIALCFHNVSPEQQSVTLDLDQMGLPAGRWRELITGQQTILEGPARLVLQGYEVCWWVPSPQG